MQPILAFDACHRLQHLLQGSDNKIANGVVNREGEAGEQDDERQSSQQNLPIEGATQLFPAHRQLQRAYHLTLWADYVATYCQGALLRGSADRQDLSSRCIQYAAEKECGILL